MNHSLPLPAAALRRGVVLLVLLAASTSLGRAQPAAEQPPVLFRNVRIFDGVSAALRSGELLVERGRISRISEGRIEPPAGAVVIDGGGRTLSPGLIDLHSHLMLQFPKGSRFAQPAVAGARAAAAARFYLESGFTTLRDAGGTPPDFARAIDAGLIEGPRVFPSGAMISQTGGHGDWRGPHDPHPRLGGCAADALLGGGAAVVVDGEALTLAAVRENLRLGATQIKIMGGGGVASEYDPLHSLQPSPAEIRAAVQAASDWGTYVMAHAYTSRAVRRLIDNGVRVIEHGHLIDEATARYCAEKNVPISTQLAIFRLAGEVPGMTEANRRKLREVQAGLDRLMGYIRRFGIRTGFGTDLIFGLYTQLGREFTERARYFTPLEIMRQVTSESAEIVRLCGSLNPYGNFGELREGWLADLVLLDGDPLADISLLSRPSDAVVVVLKGGRIVVDHRE